jgi:beta-N-acetylhexosaminidase
VIVLLSFLDGGALAGALRAPSWLAASTPTPLTRPPRAAVAKPGGGIGLGPSPTPSQEAQVEALLGRMTLRQKVGQMLMFGFPGTTADAAASRIRGYAPGSIFLLWNTVDAAQTAQLTRGLQQLAAESGAGIPLFVSIDHEGGAIQRLRAGVTYFPAKQALGATASPELARLEGAVEGRELRALGINVSLGPSLDVDSNPANPIIGAYQRSLGSSPELVARLGLAYVEGLQGERVAAVVKHFPGHGDTSTDSHLALPSLSRDWATLDRLELPPFRAVIGSTAAVMTSHIMFPDLDPTWPAGLSPVFVRQLLRERLGYDGLVMTDDTDKMAAITSNFRPGTATVQAVRSGSDLVIVAENDQRQDESFAALLDAAERGEIPPSRIDDSVRRILRAKMTYGLFEEQPAYRPGSTGTAEGADAVRRVAEGAITLVQDEGALLPLRGGRIVVVSPDALPAGRGGTRLGEQIAQRQPQTSEIVFSLTGNNSGVLERALAAARGADAVVVGTRDAGPWQRSLLQALKAAGAPTIVVGFGPPYEVARLPRGVTYLAAYWPQTELVDAAVKVLFGQIPAGGRLPVRIAGLYEPGHRYEKTPVRPARSP